MDNYRARSLLNELLELSFDRSSFFKNPKSKKQITIGMNCRINIIKDNYVNIFKSLSRQRTVSTTEILNTHINSFYFHVRGLLDNIAWALQYEFNLINDTGKRNYKFDIDLRKPVFKRNLLIYNERLYEVLDQHSDWMRELQSKRDPIAHQIPLIVPHNFLTNDQEICEYNVNMTKYGEKMENGQFSEGLEYLDKAKATGTFSDICFLQNDEIKVFNILEILWYDLKNVHEIVLELFGKNYKKI